MVERIRALCVAHNISLNRLEKECGLTGGTVNKWDAKRPSADRLASVASFFGVSMEFLLTGKEKAPAHAEPELSEDEAILLSAFRALPEAEKRSVLLLLQRAAGQDPSNPASV